VLEGFSFAESLELPESLAEHRDQNVVVEKHVQGFLNVVIGAVQHQEVHCELAELHRVQIQHAFTPGDVARLVRLGAAEVQRLHVLVELSIVLLSLCAIILIFWWNLYLLFVKHTLHFLFLVASIVAFD